MLDLVSQIWLMVLYVVIIIMLIIIIEMIGVGVVAIVLEIILPCLHPQQQFSFLLPSKQH